MTIVARIAVHFGVVLIALFVVLIAGSTVVYFALESRGWQKLQIDASWCKQQASAAEPLIEALERHHERFGVYPEALDELAPEFLESIPRPVPHPSGNGGDKWCYHRLNYDDYLLSVTALHWVSTYDALVYRRTGEYPDPWLDHRFSDRFDDWVYVIGAQTLEPSVTPSRTRPIRSQSK